MIVISASCFEKHKPYEIKKMMTLSRKFRHTGEASLTVFFSEMGGGAVGSDMTLRENWSVFIRCRTMPLGAALAL